MTKSELKKQQQLAEQNMIEMNLVIGQYYYGSALNGPFHQNTTLLMAVVKKIMDARYWFAVYAFRDIDPETRILSIKYRCMFSNEGSGRLGAGEKFNDDFLQSTPELAIHYSVYRFVKFGLEY